MAEAILHDPPAYGALTVVTTALPVALALSRLRCVDVYSLGGLVTAEHQAEEGSWPIEQLARLHVDTAIISPDGIDPAGGLTCISPTAAAVAEAQVKAAGRTVVVANPGSLGHISRFRFAEITAVSDVAFLSGSAPAQPRKTTAAATTVRPAQTRNDILAALQELGI